MSFTTQSGIRRSSRLSKKVSQLDHGTSVAVSETSRVASDSHSVSSQVSTPRRSKRIAALRVLSDNKNFSQFEQLVDTIVEKKFRFNPVNEIITYDDVSSAHVSSTQSRYPTRAGTRISYAHYFDGERDTTLRHRSTPRSNSRYNLRTLRRVDYGSL